MNVYYIYKSKGFAKIGSKSITFANRVSWQLQINTFDAVLNTNTDEWFSLIKVQQQATKVFVFCTNTMWWITFYLTPSGLFQHGMTHN